MLENLETFLKSLNESSSFNQRQTVFGFLHPEPIDIFAIDQRGSRKQKGGGNKFTQTRLYVYLDAVKKVLYLLTIGDKSTQREDIETCNSL